MGSPYALRQFRYRTANPFSSTFTNAAADYWNTDNSVALRVVAFDDSGLAQEGIPDETLQTRLYGHSPSVPGLRKGALTVSTYMEGAQSDLTVNPVATVLSKMLGAVQSPTNARSTTIGASSTTTNVTVDAASTYVVRGQAALIGVKGDARGMGEVRPIVNVGTGWIELGIATNAAPTSGDAIVFSTTVYATESTLKGADREYFETLTIGKATADQRQTVGGSGTFQVTGLGPGELPKVDIELSAADHRWVPSLSRTSFDHSVTPSGNAPAFDRSIGLFHLGDNGSTTRTCIKAGDFTFNPQITLEEDPGPCGVNGITGHTDTGGVPTLEATLLLDEDMDGLATDYGAGTAKYAILQLGHTAQKCAAIEFQKCYLKDLPITAQINNLSGVKVVLEADEAYDSSSEVAGSCEKIHFF